MFSLEGKVALVTGSSRGLGRVQALTLAKAGADVVISDILIESDPQRQQMAEKFGPLAQVMSARNVVFAESTSEEIQKMGHRSVALKMDVTDREQVQEVVAKVKEQFGRIDILVNNAGTVDHTAQIVNQKDAMWDRDINVNLTGNYNCSKAVWPLMQEQNWGRIICISSIVGVIGGFGQASYSSSKAGVIGLAKSLALEGARHNITVNAICPGIMLSEAAKGAEGQPMFERMKARTAFKRFGEPEDIAHAVCFLASEEARYITGVALPVAGGIDLFTF